MADMNQFKGSGITPDMISLKSRGTYIALGLFLGCLGIHNFYAGHTGRAVLGLFTGGLCGILTIIDLITMNTDGDGKIML